MERPDMERIKNALFKLSTSNALTKDFEAVFIYAMALEAELRSQKEPDVSTEDTSPTCWWWKITIPGYEYNNNGADYYPDAYEDFQGTEEELRAYLLKNETAYQVAILLQKRNPNRYFYDRHALNLLNSDVWDALGSVDDAPCSEWCRDVVQITQVEVTRPYSATRIVEDAKAIAVTATAERILAAEQKAGEKQAKDNDEAAAAERAEFLRLQEKYGGS